MVAILLSTYNGEKYLANQLSSILDQSYSDFKLYIVDDGSADNTNSIIDEFIAIDQRVVKLHKESKHDGPCISFMWLLGQIDADFYFFCDQDDAWMSDKIKKSMVLAEQYSTTKPLLIHSDLKIVDESMQILHESYWAFNGTKRSEFCSFDFHCAYNNIPGCSMLINKISRNLSLPIPKTAKMHDAWISLVVSFHKGNIIAVDEPLLFYRQHANNTIGARNSRSLLQKIYHIRSIINENRNLYKTVNVLQPMSTLQYFLNKIKIYFSLSKH
jgi:rhamnosyltransferase